MHAKRAQTWLAGTRTPMGADPATNRAPERHEGAHAFDPVTRRCTRNQTAPPASLPDAPRCQGRGSRLLLFRSQKGIRTVAEQSSWSQMGVTPQKGVCIAADLWMYRSTKKGLVASKSGSRWRLSAIMRMYRSSHKGADRDSNFCGQSVRSNGPGSPRDQPFCILRPDLQHPKGRSSHIGAAKVRTCAVSAPLMRRQRSTSVPFGARSRANSSVFASVSR